MYDWRSHEIVNKELALYDMQTGPILLYTMIVLPTVIWIVSDQFQTTPSEPEEAALRDSSDDLAAPRGVRE